LFQKKLGILKRSWLEIEKSVVQGSVATVVLEEKSLKVHITHGTESVELDDLVMCCQMKRRQSVFGIS
jgi:hypothetical protein